MVLLWEQKDSNYAQMAKTNIPPAKGDFRRLGESILTLWLAKRHLNSNMSKCFFFLFLLEMDAIHWFSLKVWNFIYVLPIWQSNNATIVNHKNMLARWLPRSFSFSSRGPTVKQWHWLFALQLMSYFVSLSRQFYPLGIRGSSDIQRHFFGSPDNQGTAALDSLSRLQRTKVSSKRIKKW